MARKYNFTGVMLSYEMSIPEIPVAWYVDLRRLHAGRIVQSGMGLLEGGDD